MPFYMIQASYTAESWANQVDNPVDPVARLKPMADAAGITIEGLWFSYGDYDVVLIGQAPDNVTNVSTVLAAVAGGAIKNVKTTPLLTVDEGLEALRKAKQLSYQPPG